MVGAGGCVVGGAGLFVAIISAILGSVGMLVPLNPAPPESRCGGTIPLGDVGTAGVVGNNGRAGAAGIVGDAGRVGIVGDAWFTLSLVGILLVAG